MQRLSIARSLQLALFALTLALALVAALGVASLYRARQRYEDRLAQSAELSTAAANLEVTGLLSRHARAGSAAANAFRHATTVAAGLAQQDPASRRLVRAQAAALVAGRPTTSQRIAAQLQTRQRQRQNEARSKARSDSRRAVVLIAIAGALALIAALALIGVLVASMRRPLDALVKATRALAGGELERRVTPAGPRELRELGSAFNAMGAELAAAQRRIEEERRRLANTIESLGDGLVVTVPGSSTIATVNPRARELAPELSTCQQVDAEESPLPPLEEALGTETIIEHGGRSLAITAAWLGHGDGVVWTLRDMTERLRLERAKSEFVATASHELRSPLTSIKGFVELLARSPEQMSARQREFVEIILRSTDRLVDLVNDLLDVARIEADRVEIDPRPIDVGEAAREVVDLMAPRFAERGQALSLYVAPTLPLALADPDRIRQIVANLVTNAHLYTEDGGRVSVSVEPDRAWVQIVVRDTGIGMSAEEIERIFDRFYRVRGGERSNPGTGLGLSIVKSLVELHHGRIEVKSEPGRGSTFRVLLPAAGIATVPGTSLEVLRGRRILVVDDEPDIAELIAGQLAPFEVRADVVTSGEQALAALREDRFDAITLDILMPGMDGFEVLRQIRADPQLRETPIVFVSVFSGRQELAGEWVVSKPIDADELRAVVGAAVSAGRSRVLVVGREELRPVLAPALADLGIEHEWERTGAAAARVCGERRFEVALVDVGIRNPQAVLQALDLRGRRLRRAVILFSDQSTPAPPGIANLGMEVIPVDQAAAALQAALRGERGH